MAFWFERFDSLVGSGKKRGVTEEVVLGNVHPGRAYFPYYVPTM
jgi:hypothetical protein